MILGLGKHLSAQMSFMPQNALPRQLTKLQKTIFRRQVLRHLICCKQQQHPPHHRYRDHTTSTGTLYAQLNEAFRGKVAGPWCPRLHSESNLNSFVLRLGTRILKCEYENSGFLGPASPQLSSHAKRLNTTAEVTVSHTESGQIGIEIKLNLIDREVGLQTRREGILSLLHDSPYYNVLSRTNWTEFPRDQRLQPEWGSIISGCWIEDPILNYATAALFAVESYGRGFDTDVHCEKLNASGQSVTGCPQPSTGDIYPHATITQITYDKNDQRLVIGCKAFNILVTEIWRLEKDCSSEPAFSAGSYRMGRAPSLLIENMVSAQAASIFTLCSVYPASGDASMASALLSRMAKELN
ncbi:hypothetical protein BGZ94_007965 [Podila epigama]|nr:hypothetical protein BGZ94_007965 [Podila epigama]